MAKGAALVAKQAKWRASRSPAIYVKALGLHWRDGRLLAAEVSKARA
jgi:hypothetical protein